MPLAGLYSSSLPLSRVLLHLKGQLKPSSVWASLLCFPQLLPSTHSVQFSSVQWLSRVRLFATPWTAEWPGLPVHHQLAEFTQTHVHWVGDAIQPSHSLSSPSPPAFYLSQQKVLIFFCVLWACALSPQRGHKAAKGMRPPEASLIFTAFSSVLQTEVI